MGVTEGVWHPRRVVPCTRPAPGRCDARTVVWITSAAGAQKDPSLASVAPQAAIYRRPKDPDVQWTPRLASGVLQGHRMAHILGTCSPKMDHLGIVAASRTFGQPGCHGSAQKRVPVIHHVICQSH